MIDRREEILDRLRVIGSEVPGILDSIRNTETISGTARPVVVVHDASEDTSGLAQRNARFFPKDLIQMTPQTFILLGARRLIVGTKVNELRRQFIQLVWTDSQLKALCGTNGDIRYTGCGLDTSEGETREARLQLNFEFTYVLDVRELI